MCIKKSMQPSEGICVVRRKPKFCNPWRYGKFDNRQCHQGELCLWDPHVELGACVERARANGGDQSKYFELLMLNLDRKKILTYI